MAQRSSPADPRAPEPEYGNPPVADGINNPRESQLRSFFVNLGIVTAALAVLLVLINLAAILLTPFIPFSWERGLVGDEFFASRLDETGRARQEELRRVAALMTARIDLPEGMEVTVHYNPGRTVNAYAALGGQIVVYQGLLDLLESEDELAMVLGHEISHVKNRDVIRGMVRAAGLVLLFAGIQDGNAYVEGVSSLGMAGYSRSQESAADRAAVRALGAEYGHAGGAVRFFTALAVKVEAREANGGRVPVASLSSSHPDTAYRLECSQREAADNEFPVEGNLTPLSRFFRESVTSGGRADNR